jgi:predicted PurR-regulated permease PerM
VTSTDPVAAEPDRGSGDSGAPTWIASVVRNGIWQAIAAILITLAALWFLGQARSLVRYLILAWLLSIALEPAVFYLHDKRGWRRGSATGLILAAVLALIVVMGVLLVPVLSHGISQISTNVPKYVAQINSYTQRHFHTTVISVTSSQQSGQAAQGASNFLKQHGKDILGAIGGALGAIFSIFTIGLFTFYLTANGPKVRRALLSRMRPERQERALWALNEAIKKMGGYFYSRGLLALINGTLMFITLEILGVPFALPLAMFEGVVAEFIPVVGTYVAGAIPVLVALAEVSPTAALIVVVEILVYQQVENYFLSPRISQKTMELNAGIAFGAAMAGGAVGGFIGAFFALPIAAVIQSFLSNYSKKYEVTESDLTTVDPPKTPKPKEERHGLRRRHPAGAAEPGEATEPATS